MRTDFVNNASEKKFVFTPWRYDSIERNFIKENLKKTGVFVDIGANVGIYSMTALQALGPEGRLIAFEPNDFARGRLLFNLVATRGNSGTMVDVFNLAVSDEDGTAILFIPFHNIGAASLRSQKACEGNEVLVKSVRLASFLSEADVHDIDILKIDVEGAEDRALYSFLKNENQERLPRSLIIENSDHLWGKDLRKVLSSRGFKELYKGKMNTIFQR